MRLLDMILRADDARKALAQAQPGPDADRLALEADAWLEAAADRVAFVARRIDEASA